MRLVAVAVVTAFVMVGAAQAAEKSSEPIPRFVSLRADTVNLRAGPGSRYPIRTVFKKRGYPVEIIGELDQWRHVVDANGDDGWVHERMLTGKRNVIVQSQPGAPRILRQAADRTASPVAKLDAGVMAHLLECRDSWCRIEVQSGASEVSGWLAQNDLWGVLPNEIVK